ncbi:NRDE family protein [Novosphingobium colocasiae]
MSEAGRSAVVTNYRTPEGAQPGRPSRGKLVTDVLCGRESEPVATMNPFNLFLVDRGRVSLLTNYPAQEDRPLPPRPPRPVQRRLRCALGQDPPPDRRA